MEKEKDYLDILKLSIGIIAFIIISNIVVNAYFCTSLKKIQSENLTHIEQIIQNIEIKDNKKNNFTLNFKNEDLSNINEKTYADFLIQYNQNQSNWLNFWLTILSITFAFLALIVPICFMKLYQDKKNEIDQLIKETREQKESMQLNVDDVKAKSEKISKDLIEVKRFYNETKAEADYTQILNQYAKDKNINTDKIITKLENILKIKPKHVGCCMILTYIYADKKNYPKAVEYATKTYEFSGQDKTHLYNLIEVLLLNDEFERAVSYLKQYKKYKYSKIYKDDYEKWLNQIDKINDSVLKEKAINLLEQLNKSERPNYNFSFNSIKKSERRGNIDDKK